MLCTSCISGQKIDPRIQNKTGIVVVCNIPDAFMDGIILITGGTEEHAELFRYSPKTLQHITGSDMEIGIFSETGMVQEPFNETGDFFVTIALYTPTEPRTQQFFKVQSSFVNGSTVVDLAEYSKK
jgi:hypothetical protein